jgi:hypothetical protein
MNDTWKTIVLTVALAFGGFYAKTVGDTTARIEAMVITQSTRITRTEDRVAILERQQDVVNATRFTTIHGYQMAEIISQLAAEVHDLRRYHVASQPPFNPRAYMPPYLQSERPPVRK